MREAAWLMRLSIWTERSVSGSAERLGSLLQHVCAAFDCRQRVFEVV